MAATDEKRSEGKFASRYDKNALYPLVADVCRHVNPDDPQSVSMVDWDAARAAAGHPHAPSARAIYGRLKRPWDEIKQIALDPSRNIAQTEAQARKTKPRKLMASELHFALNRVARELGARTFSVVDYDRIRDRLIAKDRRERGDDAIMPDLLPTSFEIIEQWETWSAALAAAGLEPYEQPHERTAVSPADAYDLLIELSGKLPNREAIEELRARHGISIGRMPPKAEWDAFVTEHAEECAKRGLDTPTAVMTKADRDELEIPADMLATLPRKRPKGYRTYERCLQALAEFLQTPGIEHTQRNYQKLSKGNPNWPALRAITDHANYGPMVDAARHMIRTGEILPLEQVKATAD
jgi:hypothetical protein